MYRTNTCGELRIENVGEKDTQINCTANLQAAEKLFPKVTKAKALFASKPASTLSLILRTYSCDSLKTFSVFNFRQSSIVNLSSFILITVFQKRFYSVGFSISLRFEVFFFHLLRIFCISSIVPLKNFNNSLMASSLVSAMQYSPLLL